MGASPSRFYAGIVADGATDGEILSALVQQALSGDSRNLRPTETIFLEPLKLRHFVDKFWDGFDREARPDLACKAATDLSQDVLGLIFKAVDALKVRIGRPCCCKDLLILSADSEKPLRRRDDYFSDRLWALPRILWGAVERYYHSMASRYYQIDKSPLIIPLVTFPSTDIIIAAARTADDGRFDGHGCRARELKMRLYGTDKLRQLRRQDLQKKALRFLNSTGITRIHRHIPETRLFLHILSWHGA